MEQFISQIESHLQSSILLSLAASYLGGVLMSLTPCLYPMIPITAGVIGSSNLDGSKVRGFTLSLCYVAGMALTYAALGLFAAATGKFFGTVSTHPVTLIAIGNILLLFALSMLDVFHLPHFGGNSKVRMRGLPGVFLIGMSSGMIVGPCTAPVLGSLLAYVGTTGNLALGGAMLFVFAFGMGTMLLLVGTFSGMLASIPRSGPWMETAKKIIALLIIVLAQYLFVQAGRMML
jgi:thiol:disulfide interchange protein DsbD